MDLTEGSETSANINKTPGNHPKVDILPYILYLIDIHNRMEHSKIKAAINQSNFNYAF
jgi:hypothetical protein